MSARPRRRSRRALVTTAALSAAGAAVVVVLVAWGSLRLDYYFDEMWRADMVRSANPIDRYLRHDTPTPPGWILSMWAVLRVLPGRRPVVRLLALVPAVLTSVVMADALRRVLAARRVVTHPGLVAAGAVVLTLVTPTLAHNSTYLNNYWVDILVGTLAMWGTVMIVLGPARLRGRVTWLLIGLVVIAPWFSQGALFMAPGLLVVVWWHRDHVVAVIPPVAVGAGVAVSGAIVGLAFFRPVTSGTAVDEFWRADSVAGLGVGGSLRPLAETFVDAAYPDWLAGSLAGALVGVAMSVIGAVVVSRAVAWWVPVVLGAQVCAYVASFAVGWPVTAVRVNLAFLYPLLVLAPVGVLYLVATATRTLAARPALLAVPLGTLLLVVVAWPREVTRAATTTEVFARGLTADLESIAAGATDGDVVVAYHPLSEWYVHDRLANDGSVADVTLISELSVGRRVDHDLDALVAERASAPRSIWCVVPFEVGPVRATTACEAGSGWIEVARDAGERALVIRLERATA